jgi:trehalose-phosphatase
MQQAEPQRRLDTFFRRLAGSAANALVLDYDGTLAPFCVDRNAAVPFPGVREAILRIQLQGHTRVVLISGRPPEEVRDLLGIEPPPEIWGVHGQLRLWPDGRTDVTPLKAADQETLNDAAQWITRHGYEQMAEFKPGSVALHWRGLPPEPAAEARNTIRQAWAPLAESGHLSLLEFDGGIELRPREPNKGTAVLSLLGELPPDAAFAYLGDDTTDEDAFRVLERTEALTVLVRSEWRESAARTWIRPPEDLLWFLAEWLERCKTAV